MVAKPIRVDSITGIWTYLLSIDWEERWLWVLMAFHLSCTILTLLSVLCKKYYPQIGLFMFYLCLAFSSQYINEWAAVNYKLFSNQQYFDSNGMFISFLFSLPLLCNSLVIVVYWMWDVTQVMITLKRHKVKQTRQAELKQQQHLDQKLEQSSDFSQTTNTSEETSKAEQLDESKSAQSKKTD